MLGSTMYKKRREGVNYTGNYLLKREKYKGLTLRSSIVLVFSTSNGVVTAAANPPATLPHTAASCAPILRPWKCATRALRNS